VSPSQNLLAAFGLGEPWLLWGTVLLAVPWLLHLLTKRQYRSTEWAAMRFLLEAMRKNSRRIRLEQLILLLVRTALLGLIVFGLSRPLWTAAGTLLGGFEPVQRILVLDTSFSMGLEQGGDTLYSHAQQAARDLINRSRQGDAFQLLQLSESDKTTIIAQPAYRKDDVLGEIDRLKLTNGGASLLPTLEALPQLLDQCPEMSRKLIYLISDFQRETWRSEVSNGERISRILGDLSKRARLVLYDVGVPESTNLEVASLDVSEKLLTPEQDLEIRGTIRACGSEADLTTMVELWIDGVLTAQQQVSVSAGKKPLSSFPTGSPPAAAEDFA
jgi:hypothetical protein